MMIGRPKSEIRARVKVIRLDFERRYRDRDLLRTKLYEEQSGLCFLCGKTIQSTDGVLCQIEHAIPVDLYAEFDWPIEKACAEANDTKNLFAAHGPCNNAKHNRDYEEWIADSGMERLREVPDLSEAEIAELRKTYTERGRAGARVNREKGAGIFAPGMAAKAASISGRKQVENKTGVFAPENLGKGGRANSRENKIRAGRIGGRRGGLISGRINNHNRWHTKRGIVNPNCSLCNPFKRAQ
jgi:hypothetical protein